MKLRLNASQRRKSSSSATPGESILTKPVIALPPKYYFRFVKNEPSARPQTERKYWPFPAYVQRLKGTLKTTLKKR